MNVFQQSLLAADEYLAALSQEELMKIWEGVNSKEYEGVTVEEYFKYAFDTPSVFFNFQKGIST